VTSDHQYEQQQLTAVILATAAQLDTEDRDAYTGTLAATRELPTNMHAIVALLTAAHDAPTTPLAGALVRTATTLAVQITRDAQAQAFAAQLDEL